MKIRNLRNRLQTINIALRNCSYTELQPRIMALNDFIAVNPQIKKLVDKLDLSEPDFDKWLAEATTFGKVNLAFRPTERASLSYQVLDYLDGKEPGDIILLTHGLHSGIRLDDHVRALYNSLIEPFITWLDEELIEVEDQEQALAENQNKKNTSITTVQGDYIHAGDNSQIYSKNTLIQTNNHFDQLLHEFENSYHGNDKKEIHKLIVEGKELSQSPDTSKKVLSILGTVITKTAEVATILPYILAIMNSIPK